jgi:alginate O-acetyltransferase complex protein AlgI
VLIAWVFFRSADMPTAFHLLQSMFFVDVEAGIAPTIFSLADKSPLLLTILVALAWVAPNTQTIMGYRPFGAPSSVVEVDAAKRWAPTIPWAIATILLLAFGVLAISGTNEFIYFQF